MKKLEKSPMTKLELIKAIIQDNRENQRHIYEGLESYEIGIYSGSLMFGDNDEAWPGDDEWSLIVD